MNILQILPQLNFGGVETGTVDLAKYLAEHGHRAIVISAGGKMVQELAKYKAVHYELPVHKKSILTIFLMVQEVVKIIEKENIDIVHARSRVPGWIAFFAVRKANKKSGKRVIFITTCHGHYSNKFASRVMAWGRRVIVASNAIGRHMVETFNTPNENLRLIPRGVNLERFTFKLPSSKNRTQFTIGVIGRITPLKGHAYFIKAVYRAIRQIPYINVLIVGDAPANKPHYRQDLELLVKSSALDDCVKFLGASEDIPRVFSRINLLVVPTVEEEAFGRVILEAQASGVPVIATRVGGIVDIIQDGVTGLLVAPKDSEAMAQAIIKIIKDIKLADAFASKAYDLVKEKFTLELMGQRTIAVYNEALSEYNILVIKFSAFGDIILITPALKAIRAKFPKAKVSLLTSEAGSEILKHCPYIDEILIYDYKQQSQKPKSILELGSALRRKNLDLVIDLQNNRRSHLLSFLSFASKTVGYNNRKLSFLLNVKVRLPELKLPPVDHQFNLLSAIGIEKEAEPKLELWPQKEDADYIHKLLSSHWAGGAQKLVGINIGASWPTKRLSAQQMAKLCDLLAAKDFRVILTGDESGVETADSVMKMASSQPINACGKTSLNQLACLIKKCACFVTSDSAPLHIAAAMGTKTVAVFGPTDPLRHAPPNKNSKIIKRELECSPCYKASCKELNCVQKIKPEEIAAAVLELMAKK